MADLSESNVRRSGRGSRQARMSANAGKTAGTRRLSRCGLRDRGAQVRLEPQIHWANETGLYCDNLKNQPNVRGLTDRSDTDVGVARMTCMRGMHGSRSVVLATPFGSVDRRRVQLIDGTRVVRLFAGRCVAIMDVRDQSLGVIHAEAESDDQSDEATQHAVSVN